MGLIGGSCAYYIGVRLAAVPFRVGIDEVGSQYSSHPGRRKEIRDRTSIRSYGRA